MLIHSKGKLLEWFKFVLYSYIPVAIARFPQIIIEYANNLWANLKFNNKLVFLTLDLIILSVATPKRTTNETKKSTGNAKYEWALSLICHLWFFQAIKANYIVMIKIIIPKIEWIQILEFQYDPLKYLLVDIIIREKRFHAIHIGRACNGSCFISINIFYLINKLW